jgi:hypothetical protein
MGPRPLLPVPRIQVPGASLLLFVCLTSVPKPCFATADTPASPLPARPISTGFQVLPEAMSSLQLAQLEERMRELQQWIGDYTKWKVWRDKWLSKREPGLMHSRRDRRPRPEPPAWLPQDCAEVAQARGVLVTGCALLAEARDDYAAEQIRSQTAAAVTQREAPTKTLWWEHVHLDAMWPMMQAGSSVFGVIGMHATVDVAGRFQVFVAPGAIVLNIPTETSTREWRPATDFGFAYRLFTFQFPHSHRRANVHFNFAKVWVLGNVGNLGLRTAVDLGGFSVTFQRKAED